VNTPLVTLTTDWGKQDYYNGMLKGRLMTACSGLRVVDLSHDVPSFNINNAAFIVRHSFRFFPENSIHLVLVNSESGDNDRLLVCNYMSHYFVVPDNGILGLMFSVPPDVVYQLPITSTGSFASLEAFVRATQEICNGSSLPDFCSIVDDFEPMIALRATIDDSVINGSIIYIDSYQNAITNISQTLFERIGLGRSYTIYVQSNHYKISKLSKSYKEVDPGDLLGIFNSANLLEIAIRNGYAAELLSLKVGGGVRVNFS
jgi:S-adenosyl-L-methionine hydrolase (adenosine-forming)